MAVLGDETGTHHSKAVLVGRFQEENHLQGLVVAPSVAFERGEIRPREAVIQGNAIHHRLGELDDEREKPAGNILGAVLEVHFIGGIQLGQLFQLLVVPLQIEVVHGFGQGGHKVGHCGVLVALLFVLFQRMAEGLGEDKSLIFLLFDKRGCLDLRIVGSHIANDGGADKRLVHHDQGRTVGGLSQLLFTFLEHFFSSLVHQRPELAVQRVAVMVAEFVDDDGQYRIGSIVNAPIFSDLAVADDRAQSVAAVFQSGAAPVVVRTHQQTEYDAEGAAALRSEIAVKPVVINLLVDSLERIFNLLVKVLLLQEPIVEMGFMVKIVQRFQELLFLFLGPAVKRVVAAF